MGDIIDIVTRASEAIRPLLEQAFESGYAKGRAEAEIEIVERLNAIFPGRFEHVPDVEIKPRQTDSVEMVPPEVEPSDRAAPGTVKPEVLATVRGAPNGISTADVVRRTGFKQNSIRGTLWSLSAQDGLIEKRDGRWFAKQADLELRGPENKSPSDLSDLLDSPGKKEPPNVFD